MALKTVTGTLTRSDGTPVAQAVVTAQLSAQAVITGSQEVAPIYIQTKTAADGTFSLSLQANLDLTPTTTSYLVSLGSSFTCTAVVPQTVGPFELSNIMASPPAVSPPAALDSQVVHLALTETITGAKVGTADWALKSLTIGSVPNPDLAVGTGGHYVSGPVYDSGGAIYNALWFGVKRDGRLFTDGAISAGQNIFTSASGAFLTQGDYGGRLICIAGAGAAGAPLLATISSVTNNTTLVLSVNASTTVVGAGGISFTDNNAKIQAALAASATDLVPSGRLYFPGGGYASSAPLTPPTGAIVEGAGQDNTHFYIPPCYYGNFSFAYLFQGTGVNVTLRDLHIDGLQRMGTQPANQAGLVLPGNGWRGERIHLDDWNYIAWFPNSVSDVTIIDSQSSRGANNDNLGGGGNTNYKVVRHRWNANLGANAFDNVRGSVQILDSYNYSTQQIFLEGMSDSQVRGCRLFGGGGITVQSDDGYAPATITNPFKIQILDNQVKNAKVSITAAIAIKFSILLTSPHNKGGYVTVANNEIDSPQNCGIFWGGESTMNSFGGDACYGNTVRNANVANTVGVTYNAGLGIVAPSGINVASGFKLPVHDNTIIDDRTTPLQNYTIHIGGTSIPFYCIPTEIDVQDNTLGLAVNAPSVLVTGTATAYLGKNKGLNPAGPQTAPGVPGTTVLGQNPFNYDCTVHVAGGTLTVLGVGGLPPPAIAGSWYQSNIGGTLVPGNYFYRVSAVNDAGESLTFAEGFQTVSAGTNTNRVIVCWTPVRGAKRYKVYGRSTGAELFMATVEGCSFVDDGSITPAGALPGADTTGNTATGITAAAAAGSVHTLRLPYGNSRKYTYTVAPTETWFAD